MLLNSGFADLLADYEFQWAPTLGGECYKTQLKKRYKAVLVSMGTHPWG